MSILTILTAAALPGHRSNRLQINTAHRLVMGTLRNARASAISKSVHFAVEFATTDTLLLQRMVQDSTGWQVDSTRVLTVPLPAPAYVMSSAVGTRVEFDSRGVAVNLLAPLQIDLSDPFGASKSLQAWPSGQINEL